mgnify:CR=1 FL=1
MAEPCLESDDPAIMELLGPRDQIEDSTAACRWKRSNKGLAEARASGDQRMHGEGNTKAVFGSFQCRRDASHLAFRRPNGEIDGAPQLCSVGFVGILLTGSERHHAITAIFVSP